MVNVPNAISVLRLLLVPVLLIIAWTGLGKIYFSLLLFSLLAAGGLRAPTIRIHARESSPRW